MFLIACGIISKLVRGIYVLILILVMSENGISIIYEIYNKYHKRMLYMATQILGRDRGEEVVHDVFVKLIEKYENNPEELGDKPGQYFVIIVRNHSLNVLGKERIISLPLEEEYVEQDIYQPSNDNPEASVINNEAIEKLAVLIRKLPPSERQVLEYKHIEGYTNIEIAEILGITQSAVSTRINKAKKRLKEMIIGEAVGNAY